MSTIGSLVGVLTTLSRVYDRISNKEDNTTIKEALETLDIDKATLDLAKSGGNMVNLLKPLIVEPSIFVTKNVNSRTDINSVVEHSVDVYASLYLQVFKMLSNVYHLPTTQTLNVLANKGFEYESFKDDDLAVMDIESFKHLPNIPKNIDKDFEDLSATLDKTTKVNKDDLGLISTQTIIRNIDITIDSNLTYDKKIGDFGEEKYADRMLVNIPVIIKANVHVVDLDTISSSVEHRASNAGFFKRFLQWKVGVISFRDLILAGDLVEKYKAGAMSEGNFAKELSKSASNHVNVNNLLDKRIGLNKMVFTYVMSDSELELLGKRMGYNINKGSDKSKMMDALLALNITSINEDRDLLSVYINGITGVSSTPIKKLSKGGKDGDAIEMLASALMANKSVF